MIQDDDEEEDQQNMTGELTGDTLTEFLQLLNQEDISDAVADLKVIDLSFLRKKGRHACGYKNLAQLSIETDCSEYFLVNSEISIPEDLRTNENNDHGGTESVLEAVRKSDIVSILLTKTNRRQKNIMQIVKQATAIQLCDANGSAKSIIEWGCKCNLDNHQRRAFEVITASFVLTYFKDAGKNNEEMTSHDNQSRTRFVKERKLLCQLAELRNDTVLLICCLHGPAGSGKSTVIELVLLYAKEYCSYLPNVIFCRNTIVVTAMTGVAATFICGETTHGALFLNQICKTAPEHIELWADTRLLITDEISFASKSDFQMMHKQLGKLKQQMNKKFGGLNIIFSGDFWQLEPVGRGKLLIYKDNECPYFVQWVNCYIDLNGMHRFKKDVRWGKLLMRMRNGELTKEDVEFINTKVVTVHKSRHLPKDLRYATYFNRDRDAINTALFEEHCTRLRCHNVSPRDTLIVLADKLEAKTSNGTYEPFHNRKIFWENCGEDDIKFPKERNGRMDPLLKLMLVFNNNVRRGEVNGTTATLISVCLKPNIVPIEILIHKLPVKAVYASQVISIVLKHNNPKILPNTFKLEPIEFRITARILKPQVLRMKEDDRETVKMKATQLPVISNQATTGHKLQGASINQLFVSNWNYTTNWPYVVLS